MKRLHLLPNVFTAFGLTCGLFVIFKMTTLEANALTLEILQGASGILILAAIADLIDGALARAIKAESEFGGLFDSLADAITFGVGPSVMILKTEVLANPFFLTSSAMIYAVCGVLRLVRFNVSKNNDLIAALEKNFVGLPIPAAAAAATSLNLLIYSENLSPWLMIFALPFIGYLMVSRLKFPSLKQFRFDVSSFQMIFITVMSAVLIFYGLLHHFTYVFSTIAWLYIFLALILSMIRFILGKRSKTLIDFDPDHEE